MKRFENWKKGKIVVAVLSTVLVVAAALGVTLAYSKTETGTAVNQFTVGNVTTELVEDFYQSTDTEFTKTPRITNTGASPCLVRIRIAVTPESLQEKTTVDQNGRDTGKPYLEITGFSEKWTKKQDGFFYYKEALLPGESTEPLFDTVRVNYDGFNPWIDFDIVLYHESVQSEVVNDGENITDPEQIWSLYGGAM